MFESALVQPVSYSENCTRLTCNSLDHIGEKDVLMYSVEVLLIQGLFEFAHASTHHVYITAAFLSISIQILTLFLS